MSTLAHVVDVGIDTDVLDVPEQNTCVKCDARIPDRLDICPPCLDKLREKDSAYGSI